MNVEQLLFEVAAEDFGDILAELKATHAGLAKLLGGVAKNVFLSHNHAVSSHGN